MLIIPESRIQQENLEFKASLGYLVTSRSTWVIEHDPVSKNFCGGLIALMALLHLSLHGSLLLCEFAASPVKR
jgi:hypothetical protein